MSCVMINTVVQYILCYIRVNRTTSQATRICSRDHRRGQGGSMRTQHANERVEVRVRALVSPFDPTSEEIKGNTTGNAP